MINPELLRQLGWKQDLIDEVTRLAPSLRGLGDTISEIDDPAGMPLSGGTTTLIVGEIPDTASSEFRVGYNIRRM